MVSKNLPLILIICPKLFFITVSKLAKKIKSEYASYTLLPKVLSFEILGIFLFV